jgi:hypothetical protein
MLSPYAQPEVNKIYNLLFCDDIALFKPAKVEADWQQMLFDEKPDTGALLALAEDEGNESRVRALAYRRLRELGQRVPARKLLGTVIEVPLDNGLDVLAAYADGRVPTSTPRASCRSLKAPRRRCKRPFTSCLMHRKVSSTISARWTGHACRRRRAIMFA